MDKNLIFYDGDCMLCNKTIHFILKRDELNSFKFSSLHSDFARLYLKNLNVIIGDDFTTIYLIEDGKLYSKSTAILKIGKKLSNLGLLSRILLMIPKFIRDSIYSIISNNRNKIFVKQSENCLLLLT